MMATIEGSDHGHDGHPRDLGLFFVATFGWTWALWIPAGLAERGSIDLPVPVLLLWLTGAFGPMVAGIVVSAHTSGVAGVKALFGQLTFRGVSPRWYAIAAGIGALNLAPAVVHTASGGGVDGAALAAQLVALPVVFVLIATVGGGLDEEMGWRGFALPRLQAALHPVAANLLLGSIWAAWHLPMWLDPASSYADYPVPVYVATIVGQSFVLGWAYNASGNSLLIAVLAHASANTVDGLRYTILGDERGLLAYQLILMAVSVGAAVAVTVATRGRLGSQLAAGATRSRSLTSATEVDEPAARRASLMG